MATLLDKLSICFLIPIAKKNTFELEKKHVKCAQFLSVSVDSVNDVFGKEAV